MRGVVPVPPRQYCNETLLLSRERTILVCVFAICGVQLEVRSWNRAAAAMRVSNATHRSATRRALNARSTRLDPTALLLTVVAGSVLLLMRVLHRLANVVLITLRDICWTLAK